MSPDSAKEAKIKLEELYKKHRNNDFSYELMFWGFKTWIESQIEDAV